MAWEIYITADVDRWLDELAGEDLESYRQVLEAVEALEVDGPSLGRPLVDRVKGSELHNLKELRPGSAGSTEIRVLFVFDPCRSAILLVGGDKSGNWSRWYRENIPLAERLYKRYLSDRSKEEE